MRNQPTAWLCVLGLASVPSVIAPNAAHGQAAAEDRTHTEAAKGWPRDAVRGAKAMVATDEELGANARVEILRRGGNAVDAAVAVGFALAVVEPAAGNIGGGGFMLVRLAGGKGRIPGFPGRGGGKATRET